MFIVTLYITLACYQRLEGTLEDAVLLLTSKLMYSGVLFAADGIMNAFDIKLQCNKDSDVFIDKRHL